MSNMLMNSLAIPDVKLITPKVHRDARGFFCETFSAEAFKEAGLHETFVQDNHSLSVNPGVVRGLHFQEPPYAQGKLIRVVRGAIFDVAVDIRKGSPTFGQHVSETLTAENFHQLWVPTGFAHGFCTLEPNTEVIYKVTSVYAPASDRGIQWNDPELGVPWPVTHQDAILSEKDKKLPQLNDIETPFVYSETTR